MNEIIIIHINLVVEGQDSKQGPLGKKIHHYQTQIVKFYLHHFNLMPFLAEPQEFNNLAISRNNGGSSSPIDSYSIDKIFFTKALICGVTSPKNKNALDINPGELQILKYFYKKKVILVLQEVYTSYNVFH